MTVNEIELIKNMRNENKSYSEIAKLLGRHKDTISSWCRQNELGGSRGKQTKNKDIDIREKNFKIKFENKHKDFTYISGYENNYSQIIIKCNTCNTERKINASSLYSDNIKCKKCIEDKNKDRKKQYYIENKERIKEYSKQYYEENKEKYKECMNKWREKNQENIMLYKKQWKEDNKDYEKQYYEDNKEKLREYKRNWHSINKEKYKGQRRISKQKRRAKLKSLPATLSIEQWKTIKEDFNHQCAYCGKQLKNLTQDHFIPLSKDGEYTKENIIPACRSCNCSKNDKDFFEWYPVQPFYRKEREQYILEYLGNSQQNKQELACAL